ncbi:MAG: hypothetical protein WBA22_09655 [Candidatus Methanofastidiosia archaeon]
MTELEFNVCVDDVKRRLEKESFKLELGNRLRSFLFAVSILMFILLYFVEEYSFLNTVLKHFILPLFVSLVIATLLVLPFVRTGINSSELIVYYLSEVARKLDSTIMVTNRENILRELSKIRKESGLIESFLGEYSPGEIREKAAPFSEEIAEFIQNLDSICKKISYIVKNNPIIDLDCLQLSLYRMAVHLCEHRNGVANIENHLEEINILLSEYPEDEEFAGSRYERSKVVFHEEWNHNFLLRFIIGASFLLIPYYLIFYPKYELWAIALVPVIIAWAYHH